KGLRQSYRGGRKALAKAFASGSAEDFHEWRKALQHHWRHMQLLTPCWPSELSARVEISRSLSQILGDDHDIAMLQHLISAPTMSFASPDVTASFLKHCRSRPRELRRDAKHLGIPPQFPLPAAALLQEGSGDIRARKRHGRRRDQMLQHGDVMVVAKDLRQAPRDLDPRRKLGRPARGEQLHMAPMMLQGLAPFVEILGTAAGEGLGQGLAAAAIRLAEAL